MQNRGIGYGRTNGGSMNLKNMMKEPSVVIVILNWNGQKFLQQFLPSVFNSPYPNLQIVVGDNASTDDSINYLKNNFPLVKIIENDQNYGFSEGYNRILEQLTADYFVLLNSDVEVTVGWIRPIIDLMESDDEIAIAQPKIKSFHQRSHFEYAGAAGGYLDYLGYPFTRGRIFGAVEQDKGQYNDHREIFWASGCALFIKSAIWKRLGGFDVLFFAHMEEIDLCWRAKNLGYKVMYCGSSTIYHVGGGTLNAESPFKTYLNFRNNHYLLKKNLQPSKARWVIAYRFCLDFLALIKFVLTGKFKNAAAISKAHWHVVKALWNKKVVFNQDVSEHPNTSGFYTKSIVFVYFVLRKKIFSKLKI